MASEQQKNTPRALNSGYWLAPPLFGGFPARESRGQNEPYHHWTKIGRTGYITFAVWGIPNASDGGTRSAMAHK